MRSPSSALTTVCISNKTIYLSFIILPLQVLFLVLTSKTGQWIYHFVGILQICVQPDSAPVVKLAQRILRRQKLNLSDLDSKQAFHNSLRDFRLAHYLAEQKIVREKQILVFFLQILKNRFRQISSLLQMDLARAPLVLIRVLRTFTGSIAKKSERFFPIFLKALFPQFLQFWEEQRFPVPFQGYQGSQ